MAKRNRYLVAYEIRDDRRLRLVHKTVKGYGWPMQYSVFICELDTMELFALRTDLGKIIHHAADSIAIVDLGDPAGRGVKCFSFMGVANRLPSASGPVIV